MTNFTLWKCFGRFRLLIVSYYSWLRIKMPENKLLKTSVENKRISQNNTLKLDKLKSN